MADEAFATVADLEARWRPLTDAERQRVQTLLEDASDVIKAEFPRWKSLPAIRLRRVACSIVKRALLADIQNGTNSGLLEARGTVASESVTAGPFTQQLSYSNPDGNLFLTRSERRALRGVVLPGEVDLLKPGVPS